MVHHEIVDVLVFALFDLVDLDLHAKSQLTLQVLHFLVVLLNEGLLVGLELLLQKLQLLLVLGRFSLDLANVRLIVPLVVLLLVGLAIPVVLLCHLMVVVLFGHDFSALHLYIGDVLLVLVLVVLHLLQVGYHKRVVGLLLALHLRIEVLDLRFQLLNLFAGVHVEVMDHILLDLQGIALHLCITQLLS